ncbi:hypothetical protein Ami103574_14125 [Aminipila butyrica]|uniref:DUF5666 domain-containing protein n=1 Tax=Aminipila butyrica TaxID=433296 RepID=A0A858C1F7_9FIRM|nr:hypothetical protein [Aminipila butyrica]QIB70356.1 hypothetical protein Ami103574_14125 [Aminipila butyrica]
MKKITVFLLIGSLAAAVSLTGCGSAAGTTETDGTTPAAVETQREQGLQYGQIKSISGDTVTIALGTMADVRPPEGRNGQLEKDQTTTPALQADSESTQSDSGDQQRPAKPDGEAPADGQTPPDGANGGKRPDGQTPPDDDTAGLTGKSNITLTDETLTITLTDETTIGYMNGSTSTAAISELSVGTTIAVSLDEDGKTATQILIIK